MPEDGPLERDEVVARVQAQVVAQDALGAGDGVEGLGLAPAGVQREGEQLPAALAVGRLLHEVLGGGDRLLGRPVDTATASRSSSTSARRSSSRRTSS